MIEKALELVFAALEEAHYDPRNIQSFTFKRSKQGATADVKIYASNDPNLRVEIAWSREELENAG